jgi:hypothetical protein
MRAVSGVSSGSLGRVRELSPARALRYTLLRFSVFSLRSETKLGMRMGVLASPSGEETEFAFLFGAGVVTGDAMRGYAAP